MCSNSIKYKEKFIFTSKSSDVCDTVIMNHLSDIQWHNGIPINKFLAINTLVEIMAMPSKTSMVETIQWLAHQLLKIFLKQLQWGNLPW